MAKLIICLPDGETWMALEHRPSILTITEDAYNDLTNGLMRPKHLTSAHILSEIVLSDAEKAL